MLTVAAQLDLLAGLLAVIAAVLSESTVRLNDALTRRVGTLRSFGHLVPPSNAGPTLRPTGQVKQARRGMRRRLTREFLFFNCRAGRGLRGGAVRQFEKGLDVIDDAPRRHRTQPCVLGDDSRW